MSFPLCPWDAWMACGLAISLRLQAGLAVGSARARLVGAGAGWSALFFSKTQACFVGRLQAVASTPVGLAPPDSVARTTLYRCVFWTDDQNAPTQGGGHNILQSLAQ